jgi:hypothetical protein
MVIVGTIAAIAVAALFAMVITQQGVSTPAPTNPSSTLHESTRDRADVPGPCFMRPARWHDDVAGPVPTCGR